jgi:hypothetical protein
MRDWLVLEKKVEGQAEEVLKQFKNHLKFQCQGKYTQF